MTDNIKSFFLVFRFFLLIVVWFGNQKASPALKPRTTSATSIPGLLGILQNEWDGVMLELHKLRKSYNATREELSETLYMHDAACRVVARLIKERDEAKAALANFQASFDPRSGAQPQAMEADVVAADHGGKKRERSAAAAPSANGSEEDNSNNAEKKTRSGITQDIVEKMVEKAGKLSKVRRKSMKTLPEGLATLEDLSALKLHGKYPLHTTSGAQRGITCLDLDQNTETHVVTAGADGKFKVFDLEQSKAVSDAVKAHGKAITCVKILGSQEEEGNPNWALNLVGSCSADKTCKIWKRDSEKGGKKPFAYDLLYTLDDHGSEVVGMDKQATGDYIVTFGKNGSWTFYDLLEGLKLSTSQAEEGVSFTCGAFHPDGLILGTGTSSESSGDVLLWDVKEQKSVATFQGHKGSITSLNFSENGYYLATASSNFEEGVKLWDLRKLQNFHTIDLSPMTSTQKFGKKPPKVVAQFDRSGCYLGVGCGSAVQVYGTKQEWKPLLGEGGFGDILSSASKGASCLQFGSLAKSIFVGSRADHNLRIYGL